MYVIFPADELIRMTYGAALPRIKPRPTLDNLREPLVPTGTRPSPLSNRNVLNEPQHHYPTHLSAIQNPNYSSRDPSPGRLSVTSSNNNQLLSPHNPHTITETDEFGYESTHVDDTYYDSGNPSIHLEPPSPGGTSNVGSKGKPAAKPKLKLHLHLGRLGRSKNTSKPEPARLRDVTEIRIANPTFTRENLQQRNYDAFFESGEPVYSLERRAPPQPSPEPELPLSSSSANSNGRPHSLGFFNKSKATLAQRSKSAEESVEVPQKGDRCPSQIFSLT